MKTEVVILIFSGALAAVFTFILNERLKQGAVRASAIIGLIAGGFTLVFPNLLSEYLTHNIPLICFGASFIGMVSSKVLDNYFLIALSGAIFTLLFLNISRYFEGFGGGLGAAACIALLISLAFPILTKKIKM